MDTIQTRPTGKRPRMNKASRTGRSPPHFEAFNPMQTPVFTIKRKPVPGTGQQHRTPGIGLASKTSEATASAQDQSSVLSLYSKAWNWPMPETLYPTPRTYGGPGMRAELPSSKRPHPELTRRRDTRECAPSQDQDRNDHVHATDRATKLLDDRRRDSLVSSMGSLTEHQRHHSAMGSETEGGSEKKAEWWIF